MRRTKGKAPQPRAGNPVAKAIVAKFQAVPVRNRLAELVDSQRALQKAKDEEFEASRYPAPVGRPRVKERRTVVSATLPMAQIIWLNEQPGSRSVIIEKAMKMLMDARAQKKI